MGVVYLNFMKIPAKRDKSSGSRGAAAPSQERVST
jgi:hypothetical protein